eukprot:sb/3475929/
MQLRYSAYTVWGDNFKNQGYIIISHVTGYQLIRGQYFLIRSVPDIILVVDFHERAYNPWHSGIEPCIVEGQRFFFTKVQSKGSSITKKKFTSQKCGIRVVIGHNWVQVDQRPRISGGRCRN